jgi:hypothetical protein
MRRRSSKDIINQILARSSGLRGKVDSNCVYCTYDDHAPGTWRQQVSACEIETCPIWPVRSRSEGKSLSPSLTPSVTPIVCEDVGKCPDTTAKRIAN